MKTKTVKRQNALAMREAEIANLRDLLQSYPSNVDRADRLALKIQEANNIRRKLGLPPIIEGA